MKLLESILVLMTLAVILLQISKRFQLPYPSLLALAGIGVAIIPFLPTILLDPQLALAIFVTPALFDAAYSTSPRELRKHWIPLAILAVAAVIFTMLTVGTVGHFMAHLTWAAAFTLGAIVSPPDASAVSAVLNRFQLPRRALLILQGESLLNDATALLLFGMAQAIALHTAGPKWKTVGSLSLAIPGGALLGFALGKLFLWIARWTAGTLSASITEIAVTFGAWILADKMHVSPILSVVALAMTIAHANPSQQLPRDRVQSVSLWSSLVFILSALAFLLLGMQALDAVRHLKGTSFQSAVIFGVAVFLTTVVTRIVWVFAYRLSAERAMAKTDTPLPPARVSFLVSWCGIRGILTIATASALPTNFPSRNLIVFAAFSVVLGTLVVQGFTIGPLIKLLRIEPDDSLQGEAQEARKELLQTALIFLESKTSPAAADIRKELEAATKQVSKLDFSVQSSGLDRIRRAVAEVQRRRLIEMRRHGDVQEDVFRLLEEELDWSALAASPSDDLTLEEV